MRFVLLPGLDGTAILFEPLLQILSGKTQAATPLTYPESLESFDNYAKFAADAVKGIDDEVVLIAESFSGPVAISLLHKPPANLRAVVLVATFVTPPHSFLLKMSGLVPGWVIGMFSPIAIKWFCANGFEHSEIVSQAAMIIRGVPTDTLKRRLRILAELPGGMEKALGACSLPLLVLEPARDRLIPSRALVSNAPGSCAVIRKIDGPHFLLQFCPQECWNEIEVFLQSI